jgi:uracil-DNA glycosylase family 4
MTLTESQDALALLAWQVELGADEAILDAPVDRFDAVEEPRPVSPSLAGAVARPPSPAPVPSAPDKAAVAAAAVSHAQALAASATSLPQLQAALAGFEACDLRYGARNLVFSDGNPEARVMIVGEAPGRDEDIQGKPFVGRAGQLLDAMLSAIGLSRHAEDVASSVYITNMLPWRPPQNRDPTPEEISMLQPFVRKHVELAAPDVLILMGNWACVGLLGKRGITRMRGNWEEVLDRPALPMFHPAYLLRNPAAKREAWADLLSLKSRLGGRP